MPQDIDVVFPTGPIPVSRGGTERALTTRARYDRSAEVTAFEQLTPTGTVRVSFRVLDDEPFFFKPGYFVGIKADASDGALRRSPYCIASPPNDDRTFKLLVRLVPEGPISVYLANLRVGDVISFRGPSGRSMLPRDDDTEIVFMVTGVGIGPFLSLVDHLLPQGFSRPVQLFWGLRLVEDICMVDELDERARRYPNFSYHITLSQPSPGWKGLRGRLTQSVPPLLSTLGGKHFYLVGNGAMVEDLSAAINDMGVDEHFIYHESYFNVRHRPDPATLDQIRSRFVATDLVSPYAHQMAGLYMPQVPVSQRPRPTGRRNRPPTG